MKVLYLSTGCFDKGGISRYNRYQISAFREILGESNVKTLSLLGKDSHSFEEPFDVDWIAGGNSLKHKIKFAIIFFRYILQWKPDVILCAHVNLSGLALFGAKLIKAKLTLNVYGLEVWSGLSADAAWGLRNAHHIISDCHFTENYLVNNKIRKANSITVIWDCVDLSKFSNTSTSITVLSKYSIPSPEKYFNILTLGRLSHSARHKGYERLIQVFSQISTRFEEARLIIAGKGDFQPTLQKMVEDAGLIEKVVFTGIVDEKDMAQVYSSAHIFSLVSDRGKGRGEGIPLTPLEALACDVPIIVGNQDGSQEAVVDEKNGYVIDPFDLEKHIQILTNLVEDRKLLEEKKRYATEVVKNNFSFKGFVNKHREFLQKIEL